MNLKLPFICRVALFSLATGFGAVASGAPVPKIMPLGDSITYGDSYAANGSQSPVPGGYRTQLYDDLHDAGYAFQFVGSVTSNASTTLINAGQTQNEGHNGISINGIAGNIDSWLASAAPDIIFLHIGTNDYAGGRTADQMTMDLSSLVNQIFTDRPAVQLYIAGIIPYNESLSSSRNQTVQAYNADIQSTVIPNSKFPSQAFYVDQFSNFVSNGAVDTSLFSANGTNNEHPNQAGYDVMGSTFAAQLVPEPGSMSVLLVIGGASMLARRKRTAR